MIKIWSLMGISFIFKFSGTMLTMPFHRNFIGIKVFRDVVDNKSTWVNSWLDNDRQQAITETKWTQITNKLLHSYCTCGQWVNSLGPRDVYMWLNWVTGLFVQAMVIHSVSAKPLPILCHIGKYIKLIWRSDTHKWNLWVPDLQMSGKDLTLLQGTRIVAPAMAVR